MGNIGPVELSWSPVDNDAASWEYRLRRSSTSGWTNEVWEPMLGSTGSTRSHTAPATALRPLYAVVQTADLTFTTDNWSTAQTASIALAAQPKAGVTVELLADNVEFTPSTLTFTTANHNIPQFVSMKLKTAPSEDTKVKATLSREVGTSFAWQVRPLNSSGVVIGSPIDGTATASNDGNLSLLWTFTNTKAIAKWQYRHKTSGDWTSVTWTDVPGGKGVVGYTVPSLTVDTEYTFQVRAVNSSGTLVGSVLGDATATPTTPAAWQDAGGTTYLSRSHTISGLNPNASYVYTVRSAKADGTYGTEIQAGTAIKSLSTEQVISGLTNGTEYTFEIRAITSAGTGPESTVKATPVTSLLAPTLTAVGQGSSVKLDWTVSTAGNATGWQYQYKQESTGSYGMWTDVPSSVNATRSYTVTGLTDATEYFFKVRAGERDRRRQ